MNLTSCIDMKRTCLVFAALLLTFLVAEARTVKKVYEIDDFTGIKATSAFQLTVEKSEDFSVEIEITEEFLPYLLVKNRGGVLELSFARLPFNLRQKDRRKVAQAVIKMPVLTQVVLSGASSLSSNDQFANAMNKFLIDLKGASTIHNLNVNTPDVVIRMTGASRARLGLRVSDVNAELNGASRLEVTGEASDVKIKVNGASRFAADSFDVEEATVVASGASNVDIRPSRSLVVELSGASKCRYYGDYEDLKVRAEKVSGASSLKHE